MKRAALVLVLAAVAVAGAADEPTRIERIESYLEQSPRHGGLRYMLAVERAKAGDFDGAMDDLERAVNSGLDFDIDAEDAFDTLRAYPGFEALRKRGQHAPVSRSRVGLTIDEPDLVPEGIAHDAVSGDFFIGSLYKRKILRVTPRGDVSQFAAGEPLGMVVGMEVDPTRRELWVMNTGGPEAPWSQALVYSVETGKLVRSFPVDTAAYPGPHFFNDVGLAPDGTAYVTDGGAAMVWRIGTIGLEPLVAPGGMPYPNGIAVSSDGKTVFVANLEAGIAMVSAETGDVTALQPSPGTCANGIDGLYFDERGLVGVQNAAGLDRLILIRYSTWPAVISRIQVLESRNERFDIPTTAAIVGDEIWMIANSQLDRLGPDNRVVEGATFSPVTILVTPLPD